MSDEEDTTILLAKNKLNNNMEKDVTIVMPIHNNSPVKKREKSNALEAISVSTFFAGWVFGYNVPMSICYLNDYINEFSLSCFDQIVLVMMWGFGGIWAFFIGNFLLHIKTKIHKMSMFSKKKCLVWFMSLICLGVIISSTCTSCLYFYFGQILIGFGSVMSISAHYVFTCEISDQKWRGLRLSLHQMGVAFGVFMCLVLTYYFRATPNGWRYAIAFNLVPIGVHLVITSSFVPNCAMGEVHSHRVGHVGSSFYWIYALTIFISFHAILSGRSIILHYATIAFPKLGIEPSEVYETVSITVTLVQLICTMISLNIIDKLGRKPTLLMSYAIMILSVSLLYVLDSDHLQTKLDDYCPHVRVVDTIGLATYYRHLPENSSIGGGGILSGDVTPPPYPMLPTPLSLISEDVMDDTIDNIPTYVVFEVIGILIFEAAYALGPATVVSVYCAEIMPSYIRGPVVFNSMTLTWLFPLVIDGFKHLSAYGLSSHHSLGLIIMYLLINFIAVLFIPETKGKTLQEIENDLIAYEQFSFHGPRHLWNFLRQQQQVMDTNEDGVGGGGGINISNGGGHLAQETVI